MYIKPLIFLIFIAGLGQLTHGLVSYPQKLPGMIQLFNFGFLAPDHSILFNLN